MSAPVMVGCTAVILALGVPLLVVSGALDVQIRMKAAADAAALAAADAATGWIEDEPCVIAEAIAVAHRAQLAVCSVDPPNAVAMVEMRAMTLLGQVLGKARAGPAECAEGC